MKKAWLLTIYLLMWIAKDPAEFAFYSTQAFEYQDVYPRKKNNPNYPPLSFAVNRIELKACLQ